MKNIDDTLKENLRSNVHIDKSFSEELQIKLKQEALNKFIVNSNMDESKKNRFDGLSIVNILKKPWVALLTMCVVAVVIATGVLVVWNYTGNSSTNLAENESKQESVKFAKLYVNSGSVNVLRNGVQTTYNSDLVLEPGDTLTSSENTIADVKTAFGRLALDSNAQIIVNDIDGNVVPEVKSGLVFVSLDNSFGKNVKFITANAEVNLTGGSAIIAQNSAIPTASSTTTSRSWSDGLYAFLVDKAKAIAITDGSTKITCIYGNVKVKTSDKELSLDTGKEVTILNKVAGTVGDLDKAQFDTTFVKKIVTEAPQTGIETGVLADMTAPVVTVISPADGILIEQNSIEIKFKSNEDVWLLNVDPWRDIKANEEVTFFVNLKNGENKIELYVKDKAYNRTVKTIVVNYKAPIAVSWGSDPNATVNGVSLAWSATGVKSSVNTYKIIRNDSIYQAFTVNDGTIVGANWVDGATTKGTGYYYAIAIYEGGIEVARTVNKSVTAQTEVYVPPVSSACSVSLYYVGYVTQVPNSNPSSKEGSRLFSFTNLVQPAKAVVSSYDYYNFSWSVSGDCPTYSGYKLVWNAGGNPVYPGSDYNYISDKNVMSGIANTYGGGTHYVRVGLYNGGSGFNYSNQMTCSGTSCW